MTHLFAYAFSISASPQSGPIDKPLQTLLNLGLATGLLLCAIGFVIGCALRAVGGNSGNYQIAQRGHSAILWSVAAAALLAGATAIINYFWGLGLLI
jgi:hypothetical protein